MDHNDQPDDDRSNPETPHSGSIGPRVGTGSYATLVAAFAAASLAAVAASARRRPDAFAVGPPWGDVIAIAGATHKLARLLSKDAVMAPLRAPFTSFESRGGPAEVNEKPKGSGLQHAVGELLSCPFCLDVWAAAALTAGVVIAPRPIRAVVAVLDSVALADAMHFIYVQLEHASEH
jgi:hypothetical protein